MTLQKYIKLIGIKKVCEIYNVSNSTVDQWLKLVSAPRPETALMIIRKTRGRVSWEGIYKPIALKRIR